MRRISTHLVAVAAGLTLALWSAPGLRGQSESSLSLVGEWQLSTDLSSEPVNLAAGVERAGGRGGGTVGGRGGGIGGGGGGIGGRGGGIGGGGMGGRGGGMGGRGGGMGGGRGGGMGGGGGAMLSEKDQREMRALADEFARPARTLALLVEDDTLILTDDDGVVRHFKIDDDTDVLFGDAKIESKTDWDDRGITQEFSGGPLKITRSFFTTTGNSQLVVAVRSQSGGRGGQPQTLKFIYNRR